MREVRHYICEICGTEYNNKSKAENCEKRHCKPIEIVKCRYLSIDNKECEFKKIGRTVDIENLIEQIRGNA